MVSVRRMRTPFFFAWATRGGGVPVAGGISRQPFALGVPLLEKRRSVDGLAGGLPKRNTGPGYHLEDEVELQYYRLQKISEGQIDLNTGDGNPCPVKATHKPIIAIGLLLRRRQTRSAVAATTSNPKADGSGTGWKASPTGLSNPEVKVLCVPSGVISRM